MLWLLDTPAPPPPPPTTVTFTDVIPGGTVKVPVDVKISELIPTAVFAAVVCVVPSLNVMAAAPTEIPMIAP
jgi:hypothetical protein